MNQEKLLNYIVNEIINIIIKNPNKEFDLKKLIKNVKTKKSLFYNIETHKIYSEIQIFKNCNKDHEIITYQNADNKYIILSKPIKILNSDCEEALKIEKENEALKIEKENEALKIEKENEALKIEKENEALKIEKETRTILYSSLIVFSLLVYTYLSKNLHIDIVFDVIKFCILLCSFILLKREKMKNNSFLFLFSIFSSIMILEIKNAVTIFLLIASLILLKKYSKKIEYDDIAENFIMGFVFFVFLVCLYALAQYYIGPIDYIILNITLMSLLIFYFFRLNKFNVLQALVFFAISFSSYSLISNLMKMLNEKNFIFHPYNDINIKLSLVSLSIAILIFTNTSIAIFLENVLTTIDKKRSYRLLKIFFSSCILALPVGHMISGINGMSFLISLLFILIIIFLFLLIYMINLKSKPKYIPNHLINFEKNLFNCQNKPKTIIWLKNFLKPLNKNNDIVFDLKIYQKNILFSFISLYIILGFILSYQDIFHYTQNDKTCTNIETGRLIYEVAGEDFVYSLYNYKESMDLLKTSNDIKDKLKDLNARKEMLYVNPEKIYESVKNFQIEKDEIITQLKKESHSKEISNLKRALTLTNEIIKRKEMHLGILNKRIYRYELNEKDKAIYDELKSNEYRLKDIDNEIENLTNIEIKIDTKNRFKIKYSFDEFFNHFEKEGNLDEAFKESQYLIFKESCKKI